MALELTYPHIEKSQGEPARLQRVPRIRVAQIVMDYQYRYERRDGCTEYIGVFAGRRLKVVVDEQADPHRVVTVHDT